MAKHDVGEEEEEEEDEPQNLMISIQSFTWSIAWLTNQVREFS